MIELSKKSAKPWINTSKLFSHKSWIPFYKKSGPANMMRNFHSKKSLPKLWKILIMTCDLTFEFWHKRDINHLIYILNIDDKLDNF